MAGSLGSIKGQMILDVKQALAAYTSVRLANLQTVTALRTGANALGTASAGMAGIGIVLAAGIGLAVKAAADFERKLDYFGAVSNATQEEYEAIRVKAIELGQDTIFSAGQIADSFVELGKSGVVTKDIIGGIGEAVANLGAAADIPLDTAANIMMSAVQTFRLSADQAVGVADLLAGAANASIVEVEDLGVSLKYAGGVAASLGMPIEDVVTSLALLGTYGIKGSTAGTSLRQMLVSLGGSTKKATKELTALGIITEDGKNKFFDEAGSAKPLAEIFQILQDATRGMGDEQKLASLKTIFQNRALASAIALTNEGASGFAAMAAEVGKTTAMEVASKRLDNLSGDVEILRGNLETLAITQGSQLQEFLRGLVQGLTSIVQWFTNLDKGVQQNILRFIAISAAIFIIVGVVGMFAASILNMVALGIQMANTLKFLGGAMGILTKGTWALNTAFLANPITWIILAVVALIAIFVLLWRNNEGFRNFFIAAWAAIQTGFAATIEWFKGIPAFFSNLWNSVSTWTTNAWNGMIAFFQSIPGAILAAVLSLGTSIVSFFSGIWTSISTTTVTAWNAVLTFFSTLPGKISAFFQALPGMIGYLIGFMVGTVIRLLINLATWAGTTFLTGWNAMIAFFVALPGNIATFFTDLYNRVVTWLTILAINGILKALELKEGIEGFFRALPGNVAAFFSQLWSNVTDWMGRTKDSAVNTASNLITGVVGFFQALPGKAAAFFSEMKEKITSKLTEAKDKAIEMGAKIVAGVIDGVTSLPGKVAGIFGDVTQSIKDKITGAFNAVKDFASGLWNGFKDGLGIHSPSFIERAIWQITGVLDDETARMKKQVVGFQKLGANLDNIGGNGTGFVGSMAGTAALVSSELAKASAYQAEMAALASNINTVKRVNPTPGLSTAQAIALASKQNAAGVERSLNVAMNPRIFIGDREITDIVRVELDDQLDQVALGTSIGVIG